MNLIDQLTQMQANGKSVVSITFILNHIGKPQDDYCEFCEPLPNSENRTWRKRLQLVKRGGEP
jgi:hypothetical protein